jgi:DNA-binding NarL/FixJ family response regulator
MPEAAELAMFEDHEASLSMMVAYLKRRGHEVVATATSPEEADELVDKLIAREMVVDAIIMDGRLLEDSEFNHGEYYSRMLKDSGVSTTIIGLSISPAPWSDIDVGKMQDREVLKDTIDNL